MRNIARGFALQRPDNEERASVFDRICDQREDVVAEGEEILLRFPKNPAVASWSTPGIELKRAQRFSGTSLRPTSRNWPDGQWRA
jgi:hypothetical protein